MSELKTYAGGCHCGKVRFEIRAEVRDVVACNCSICMKGGSLMTFVPEEHFTLLSGGEILSDYQFGKKHIHHLFCPSCGVRSFSRGKAPGSGKDMHAVNVRCLEGVDISTLNVKQFDGKSL